MTNKTNSKNLIDERYFSVVKHLIFYVIFQQGNAGIGFSVLIILMTISVSMVAALSAIGVCERCKMERGGVYFLLSHVLGARIGASIGILYCFGQVSYKFFFALFIRKNCRVMLLALLKFAIFSGCNTRCGVKWSIL